MLTEKFACNREKLSETDETLRDAVWSRLGGGGVALPGAVTGVAAIVVSGGGKREYLDFCFKLSGPEGVACTAGLMLSSGALILNVLWIGAVLFPYIDGPRHVTMPRRAYLVGAIVGISAYVWFVVWLLLN